jgi:electron transport complex protein RnfB
MTVTAEAIDAWLPQTQCTRCGYPTCRAYAEAIASGIAGIEYCPPGGVATLRALAALLGRPFPLHDPGGVSVAARQRAEIDESRCIGCRKCIDACPVDAIVGARQLMHTVIGAECSGCALCLPPCPVDCITLTPVAPATQTDSPWPEYTVAETEQWRARTGARLARLRYRKALRLANRPGAPAHEDNLPATTERERIRAEIRAAVARVKARKARPHKPST